MTDFVITFSKTGPLIFISHLDLAHTFVRAFNRAGIRLRYSTGFNPHPKLVFALPLSVGMAGENELCEVGLLDDHEPGELFDRLCKVMPPHLTIKSIEAPVKKFKNVDSAEYIFTLHGILGISENIKSFLCSESICIIKKTKSGEKQADIKPQIFAFHAAELDGSTQLVLKVQSAPDSYLNPEYVIRALEQAEIIPQGAEITCTRTRIIIK